MKKTVLEKREFIRAVPLWLAAATSGLHFVGGGYFSNILIGVLQASWLAAATSGLHYRGRGTPRYTETNGYSPERKKKGGTQGKFAVSFASVQLIFVGSTSRSSVS